jgi:hypothetical protein
MTQLLDRFINFILIGLIIFTPIAFGSVELWAFSLMELGILLIIILAAVQRYILDFSKWSNLPNDRNVHNVLNDQNVIPGFLLALFLLLILFQMLPLPSDIIKIISPKTFALRNSLTFDLSPLTSHLSFVPFATRIEFFKWLTLTGLFLFLLNWKLFNRNIMNHLILTIMLVGIAESLYGML